MAINCAPLDISSTSIRMMKRELLFFFSKQARSIRFAFWLGEGLDHDLWMEALTPLSDAFRRTNQERMDTACVVG